MKDPNPNRILPNATHRGLHVPIWPPKYEIGRTNIKEAMS